MRVEYRPCRSVSLIIFEATTCERINMGTLLMPENQEVKTGSVANADLLARPRDTGPETRITKGFTSRWLVRDS